MCITYSQIGTQRGGVGAASGDATARGAPHVNAVDRANLYEVIRIAVSRAEDIALLQSVRCEPREATRCAAPRRRRG